MIAFWHTDTGSIVGGSNDFVIDLKARFQAEHGVVPYVIGHPNDFSQWAATDEVTIMFGPPAHFHQSGRDGAGLETINLTPGFWNPISNDWYLPRQGGVNYDTAWATAQGRKDQARHLYIDSWNETGEGSGIFAAQLSSYGASDTGSCGSWVNLHADSFASDSPRHYIDVTATQAAAWNDVGEAVTYGRLFRGRTRTFRLELAGACEPGGWTLQLRMARDGTPYGATIEIPVNIE